MHLYEHILTPRISSASNDELRSLHLLARVTLHYITLHYHDSGSLDEVNNRLKPRKMAENSNAVCIRTLNELLSYVVSKDASRAVGVQNGPLVERTATHVSALCSSTI